MKKKLISLLLALTMVLSLFVPAMAIDPEGNVLPAAVDNVITLDKDYGTEGESGTVFDFNNETVTLNLNGHKLMGSVSNATNVTVENKITSTVLDLDEQGKPKYDTEDIGKEHPLTKEVTVDTPACLLAATGTYKNDVSAYVADGYDVDSDKKTVFNNENPSNFKVEIDVTANNKDYDNTTAFPDVYADEYVTVTVKVTGARYASADFTLTWDNSLFVDETFFDLMPGWVGAGEDDTVNQGFTSYRFTGAHEKVEGKPQEEYFENGEVIGRFTMRALYIDETIVKAYQDNDSEASNYYTLAAKGASSYCTFTVKSGSGTETAKVIGSWRKAKEDSTTTPLDTANLEDGVAHIILMDAMTGDVSAKTGLIYKAQGQNLLDPSYNNNTGFSALVGGVAPKGNDGNPSAKVATKVYTKDEYYGVQKKDASGNLLYHQESAEGTEGTTVTQWPVYEDDKNPVTAIEYGNAGTALTLTDIQAENAGDYVVCYKISAPGYASVTGVKDVNIAKQKVDLNWTAPSGFNSTTFEGEYSGSVFSAPTAKYTDLNNTEQTATVNVTSGPNGTELKAVGGYVFTAADTTNYEFNNPTQSVKVKGKTIEGWTLKATNWENTKDADGNAKVDNGVIWRDGTERPIGYLDVADNASFAKGDGKYYDNANFTGTGVDTADDTHTNLKDSNKYYTSTGVEVTNVVVTYEYSEGKYYKTEADLTDAPAGAKIGDEIWTVISATDGKKESELGKYKLRMTVTADNYEKMSQIVNFEIKNPIFVTENLEYVAGYSIVLAYTNETGVSFKYGSGTSAVKLYDVTNFGYKYNNNQYGNGTANYAHVYAIVIKGAADTSLVYASNEAAAELALPTGYTNMMPTGSGYKGNVYVNDVNNKTTAQVDLDDITAIQSIYNVNVNNMQDMEVVLRADVNRNKMVDVNGDVTQALAYYLNPPTTT